MTELEKKIEVSKLWGFKESDLNVDGNFVDRFPFEREKIELPNLKHNHEFGTISLAKSPNNKWAVSSSISLNQCGYGSPNSIYNKIQHDSKQEAINSEIDYIIKFCTQNADDSLSEKAIKTMEDFKNSQNQLIQQDLF